MHEYDYVITTVKMISPTTEISSKLSAMAEKSRAMCDAGTGPLFDLIVCDEAHHAVAATWVAVFQALGDIGQKYMKAEKEQELFPKQLLLTGTSHRLHVERCPVDAAHNLRIWTLTQGMQGLQGQGGVRKGVVLKRTVLYEVRYQPLATK